MNSTDSEIPLTRTLIEPRELYGFRLQFHDEAGRRVFRYRSRGMAYPVDEYDEEQAVARFRSSVMTLRQVLFATLFVACMAMVFLTHGRPSFVWLSVVALAGGAGQLVLTWYFWRKACRPIMARTPVGEALGIMGRSMRLVEQMGWKGLIVASILCAGAVIRLPDLNAAASSQWGRAGAVTVDLVIAVLIIKIALLVALKLLMGVRDRYANNNRNTI